MRKYLVGFIIGVLVAVGGIGLAQQPIRIFVDGQQVYTDVPAQMVNGRTMVPVRFIAEAFGSLVDWDEATQSVLITSPGAGSSPTIPLDGKVAKIVDAYNLVLTYHVDKELDTEALVDAGIRGMLSRVDGGYTRYENIEEVLRRQEADTGEYAGIGVMVRMVEEQVVIESVFRGSPAQASGLTSRDVIIAVDGTVIRGLLLTEVTDMIKGPPGTEVRLTVFRPGENRTLDITITRARIVIPLVEYDIVESKIAHVALSQFMPNAVEQMRGALLDLNNQGVSTILLDMRYNGGGYVDVVERIADYFLPQNVVIYQTISRDEQIVKRMTRNQALFSGDVFVLLNSSSASATEILAGALRDHLGATIMGQASYGKGTVQTGYGLSDGSRIWVTTMTYKTPAGVEINIEGIVPDVVIPQDASTLPERDAQLEQAIEYVLKSLTD